MKQVHFVHYKKIFTILVLVSLFVAGDAWGISGRLGEFGVGDSIDVPYYAYNCSGSKRAATCDSVTYSIYKDTLGHYAMPVDSGKVTATTAPSFAVSAGRGFVNYFLRICANAGNHAPGRYTAWIEAWDDTCSQMHNVWWDCYADSTTHGYAKNNRLIAGAVKAKTDQLTFTTNVVHSIPQTAVTVASGSIGAIKVATAHAVYETLFVHKEDFHSSGDTNTKDMGDTLTLIMAEILNLDAWNPANGVLCWIDGDSLYTLTVKADSLILAVSDVNKANFKATGFATSADGDSVTQAITDVNKANFKYAGGADSVRAYLATHDSTLLEVAAACGQGIGDNTCIIYVMNAVDSVAISGFNIDIEDSTSGESKGAKPTNTSGYETFSLDDGTYKISLTKTPWTITSPVYRTTTGDSTWTFYATAFDPQAPEDAAKCNVWAYTYDIENDTLTGAYMVISIDPRFGEITLDDDGTLISPYSQKDVVDAASKAEMAIYRSVELSAGSGDTVYYWIRMYDSDGNKLGECHRVVPDEDTYQVDWSD